MNEEGQFPHGGDTKAMADWMFKDSIMESRVKRRLEDIHWNVSVRTTAIQCAAKAAVTLTDLTTKGIVDMAIQFEKYIKGE